MGALSAFRGTRWDPPNPEKNMRNTVLLLASVVFLSAAACDKAPKEDAVENNFNLGALGKDKDKFNLAKDKDKLQGATPLLAK